MEPGNKTRRCKQCGQPLDGDSRDGALFCSDKCRMRNYRHQKNKEATPPQKQIEPAKEKPLSGINPPEKKSAPPLHGVVNGKENNSDTQQVPLWETVEVENPELIKIRSEIKMLEERQKRIDAEQEKIINILKAEGIDIAKALPWIGAGAGAVAGTYIVSQRKPTNKKADPNQVWKDVGTVVGLTLLGAILSSILRPDPKTEEERKLKEREDLIRQSEARAKEKKWNMERISQLQNHARTLPEWVPQKHLNKKIQQWLSGEISSGKAKKENAEAITKWNNQKTKREMENDENMSGRESITPLTEKHPDNMPRILEPGEDLQQTGNGDSTNPRLVNSMDLGKIKFRRFNFQGRWREFLGLPDIHFEAVIFGSPGSGKSTLAAQLANYLSTNFGRVIYVSAEEGISATFQDKMNLTAAMHPRLDVGDVRHWKQLELLPIDECNFLVLDSLQQLGIDEVVYKQLRQRYPNCAIISISQSTKDGKMRGSNVIAHDVDISIEVSGGVAVCIKNRFQATGRKFQVLPKPPLAGGQPKEPDQIIF
ncbi:MAG: hypothetical protein K1X81_11530 [Bacteroidia bacterium]|nr:hypothetical protein [Bacteroidia bacterium]